MKLSLCMIVRDEQEYLDACLASVASHVDEIVIIDTGSTDDTKKIAAKYGARIFDFEWIDDFSAARNFSFSKATGDWLLWLDADDVVKHAEKLKEICANTPPHISMVFVNYDYEVDENGLVRTKHWRDRLIRNDGSVTWKGRLHETPITIRNVGRAKTEEINVVHTAKPDRWDTSQARNLRILEKQLTDEGKSPDPRTLFYLAGCYKSGGNYDLALEMYELYLQLSGWDEERAAALCQVAEIHFANEEDTQASDAYLKAIRERPESPFPYIGMAKIYANGQKHERAIEWLEMAFAKPEPQTNMVVNPLSYTYEPLLVYAECLFSIGKMAEAITAVKKAKTYLDDELTTKMLDLYKQIQGHKFVAQAYMDLALYLDKNGEKDKAAKLLDVIPAGLEDNPLILQFKKQYTEPKVWPKKSIVIFTGQSILGEWGPWSLKEGTGGSEEAIVRLSKRLLEQGYTVDVFANPGALQGTYDGVVWHNYWELDLRDKFDVFISWRSPWFFDAKVHARKKYLWLHDVMEGGEFTPERLANLDKVIVLSQYHRECYPMIPDDKIFMSANGIDADEFEVYEETGQDRGTVIVRDPHAVVYQSSHVRGLAHLYDIWEDVLKEVPDAKLRIMYGWASFKAVHKDNPERMEWMEQMIQRANELPGVEDIGKVGQGQIVEEILKAGVWAYPCPFPEISCITAMKAQAGGAIPVSSTYAALNETVKWGYKMDMPEWNDKTKAEYTRLLIEALKNPKVNREAMELAARKTFSWTQVAKDWASEFQA